MTHPPCVLVPRLTAVAMLGLLVAASTGTRRLAAHTSHPGPSEPVPGSVTVLTSTPVTVALRPFAEPLPVPPVAQPSRSTNGYCVPVLPDLCFPGPIDVYDMPVLRITNHQFHPDLPPIEVWGYAGMYPGPTIEAKVGVPILVNWINGLTNNGGLYPYWLPADPKLFHGGHESGISPQKIRTVVHLHGAAVLPRYDGYPTNWFLPGESDEYFYGNIDLNSDGQTLWYHDHAIGVTANNVYAGLAGFYLVRADEFDAANGIRLPSGPYEIPLVFQDRDFAANTVVEDGITQVVTNLDASGLPWHRYAVVNGKVTPYLEVEPRPYRFRFLNGTGFRSVAPRMSITDLEGNDLKGDGVPAAPTFLVVGNEDGYLQYATNVSRIATMPGERVDVVVDFSPFTNSQYTAITMKNAFGLGGGGTNADVVGPPFITNLMQFRVTLPLANGGEPAMRIPSPLVSNWVSTASLVGAAMTNRPVTLDLSGETPFPGPPFNATNLNYPFALINMTPFDAPVAEFPHAGDIEVWEIINLSDEAHPFHIHLLDFRVVNRQRFASDTNTLTTPWGGDPNYPPAMVAKYIRDRIAGTLQPLVGYLSLNPDDLVSVQPFETGPKDVVRAAPFAVTRIVMRWPTESMFYTTPSARSGDPATDGRYIFHCHILDHEDNDMMRPLQLKPPWQPSLGVVPSPDTHPGAFNHFLLAYPYRLNQKVALETTAGLSSDPAAWVPLDGPDLPRPFLDIPNTRWLQTPPPSSTSERYYRVRAVPPQL